MKCKFDFSLDKDAVLKQGRGFGFRDIIQAIKAGKLIENKANPNKNKYPKQKIFIVELNSYIYAVPYVVDKERQVYFLKIFYPSRKLKKKHDKEKV